MLLRADQLSFGYTERGRSRASGRTRGGQVLPDHTDGLAVRDVTIDIQPGAITGLLGPNGCGKTSLLKLLAGIVAPQSGRVTLDGQPIQNLPRRDVARRIAVVPQETHPAFDYSALEMVLMGRHPHLGAFQLEGPSDVALAHDALAATGTAHLADRAYMTLSGGEKQRVVIASALAQEPHILLLDEPTASLDLGFQLEIQALLLTLNRDRGVTMVLATHDLNLAASICGRLVLMRAGRVIAQGATPDVLTPPNIRELYGVDAEVSQHAAAGHLTVVPVRRILMDAIPAALAPDSPRGSAQPAVGRWSLRVRLTLTVAGFGALAAATCLLAPLVGSTQISLARVFDTSIPFAENVDAQIFFVARLPRVFAGALVGAALASAGVVFQAMLRNPLATPFTLGVSAGSSLGAMLAILFGASAALGPLSPVPVASLAGAIVAAAIVYWLATRPGRPISTSVLLLAGVTLNSFFSALILFAQFLADYAQVYRAARWLMGDLDVGGMAPLLGALPLIVAAFAIFALLPGPLNLLSVGADAAAARGVDVARTQRLAFLSASLATAAAVSLAGPIGFVGIVVPHLVRLLVGVDHRIVLPASALFGASFLVACDLVARTLLAPVEIPVGVVTAMIGGPFFLWLLVRRG